MNRKIIVPFEIIPDNDVPIIKFYLDKVPRYAIIDTGAESTLFDKSIRDLLNVTRKEKISIVGVSGETGSSLIDIVSAKIWMHNDIKQIAILNVSGYVNDLTHLSDHFLGSGSDMKISAIFGSDMLNEFNADVDFIKHEISFKL